MILQIAQYDVLNDNKIAFLKPMHLKTNTGDFRMFFVGPGVSQNPFKTRSS